MDGPNRYGQLNVGFQMEKVGSSGPLRTPAEQLLAETEGI